MGSIPSPLQPHYAAPRCRASAPAAELAMAKAAHAKITTLNSSHVVMLSKPREVAAVILAAAAAVKD